MRYGPNQKEQTRERIIAAAGRCFRKSGYSGIGVDGLAKEAGVTSGAFYGHFDSKMEAFAAAIVSGLDELGKGIAEYRQKYGDDWWEEFASFYMNRKRTCDLSESCALQSLTPEVGRADEAVRTLFEKELLGIIELASRNPENREKAWANLAMLIGGVSLARAVASEKLSNEIAESIRHAVTIKPEK